MNKVAQTTKASPTYENNPFFIAVNGLELLFKKAQAIGIALAALAVLSFLGSFPTGSFAPMTSEPAPTPASGQAAESQATKEAQAFFDGIAAIPLEIWLLIALVVLVIMLIATVIGIVIRGVVDYTSAQLANDKEVSLTVAFHAVFANFWGYTWVIFIAGLKTFLWTLLFIIPGFIMSVRYSLSGVVYFDKKLSGNGSVKESTRLTKSGWLTTYAGHSLFNLITFGAISSLLTPGTQAILYRQFRAYDTAQQPKPRAHILSWLTLLIPPLLFVMLVLLFTGLILLIAGSQPF